METTCPRALIGLQASLLRQQLQHKYQLPKIRANHLIPKHFSSMLTVFHVVKELHSPNCPQTKNLIQTLTYKYNIKPSELVSINVRLVLNELLCI